MRKIFFLVLFLALSSLPAIAGTIPDFRLKDLENKSTTYSELKGEKLTVIDFWATWCKPCRSSIPGLVSLYKKYRSKGVQFIGINADGIRNLSKVKPFARSAGMNYPVLLDLNGEVMAELQVSALPTLLISNSSDEIVFFHQGYRPGDEKVIEQEISRALGAGQDSKNEK